MDTKIDEIADGIYRLSSYASQVAPPAGLTYNVFLILGDEPLLFHTGKRGMFPYISAAIARVLPPERLRWIAFGHYESDECGAMNEFLAAAPLAEIAHGQTACRVTLNDMADRAPRALADGEVIDLGGKRLRYLDRPHIPHGWEAGVLYEESTGTLLCGDLFTQLGDQRRHCRTRGRGRGPVSVLQPASEYGTHDPTVGHARAEDARADARTRICWRLPGVTGSAGG
jgi:flavorubredoxin